MSHDGIDLLTCSSCKGYLHLWSTPASSPHKAPVYLLPMTVIRPSPPSHSLVCMLHSKQAEAVQILPCPQLSLYSQKRLPALWLGTVLDGRALLTTAQVGQVSRWVPPCLREHAMSPSRSATHIHDYLRLSFQCLRLC